MGEWSPLNYFTADELAAAVCTEYDPETWFSKAGPNRHNNKQTIAKKLCLRCDIRTKCLEVSIEKEIPFGIWGGLTERERRKLIRKRVQS